MAYLKRQRATVTGQTSDSPTYTTPALGTPSAMVGTNLTALPAAQFSGVLPSGVTGGSGLTALGTVTSGTFEGTLNTSTTFPAGHIIKTYESHDTTSTIRSSTSYTTDGNNLVVTPAAAASQFILIHDGQGYYESGNDGALHLQLFRHVSANSTTAPARGSASEHTGMSGSARMDFAYWFGGGGYVDIGFTFGFCGIDDPDTTSQIGYYIESNCGGLTARYPQSHSHFVILEVQ
jgi:hypothetical protein